jgi:murein L,D-transpeptidase YafK
MSGNWRTRILVACLLAGAAALLEGCDDQLDNSIQSGRSLAPIPQKTLAKMDALGTTASAPVLIRAYKQEAEFEIWKQKSDGQYALLKTYPMCRWSGQLGPKVREGDRQVPEGFYTITHEQMNPNSNYYLSFNVGYPNAYDRAYGRDGGNIMVHGICSSAGCFSMTDVQISEIYAIMREAFAGGQHAVQMQSYPFRMTAENLAKHRLDPNIAFWRELKNGSDHFETTMAEPNVLVCNKHYVFGAEAAHEVSATAACPELKRDDEVETAVAAKASKDDAEVAALVAKGVKPIALVYADGGQNPVFKGRDDVSRPEALAVGPREIVLGEDGKPLPAVVQVAAAAQPKPSLAFRTAGASSTPVKIASDTSTAAPAANSGALGFVGGLTDSSKSLMSGLISRVSGEPQLRVYEPAEPVPSDVPLPPKRAASLDKPMRMATAKVDERTDPAQAQ